MILDSTNNNVLLFKIPTGKCSFYVHPPRRGLSAVVQGHPQVSTARTNKDSEFGSRTFEERG